MALTKLPEKAENIELMILKYIAEKMESELVWAFVRRRLKVEIRARLENIAAGRRSQCNCG
ncbi:hypothetical protein FJU30_17195 [Affinibrenneria salicis]|uniref:Uncharacterized protein n=1 Tax=Affinibrenneria salicis TaxID=2590031 RepID=A0A5J5FWA3_9GAMM|nr:hypothetical protein [Affinibrenneria salicis]KAA8998149.1 hypothetical protein FJU30_17195 [Affinibrenneria salicis]